MDRQDADTRIERRTVLAKISSSSFAGLPLTQIESAANPALVDESRGPDAVTLSSLFFQYPGFFGLLLPLEQQKEPPSQTNQASQLLRRQLRYAER